jgi:TPR repeat protein
MYRLGWRYETGLGSSHNPQEALRCYFKAAKLGNLDALTRLAPKCIDEPRQR